MSQGPWGPQGQQAGYNPQQGGGYQPQGGYNPQQGGAYNPQGGGYGPQGGFGPRQVSPPQRGNGRIIALVVGGLVAAAVVGLILAFVLGGDKGGTTTVTPSTPTPPGPVSPGPVTSTRPVSSPPVTSVQPTPPPTTQTSQPAPPPTTQTQAPPPVGGIDIGNGIVVTPAPGWTVSDQEPGSVVLEGASAVMIVSTLKAAPTNTGAQVVDSYLNAQAKKMTDVKRSATKEMTVDPKLSVANGQITGTLTTSQGSTPVSLVSVGSVRKSDGVAVVIGLIFVPGTDLAQVEKDFNQMASGVLRSQAG